MFDQLQESDIPILVSTERELNRFDENLKQLKKNKKNYNKSFQWARKEHAPLIFNVMPMSKIIMQVITERHEDLQSPGTEYECQIIILDGKRIFSTEDKSYLMNSTNLFKENGVTLLLDADRNSLELPELGPMMDIEAYSPLRITRDGEHLIIGSGHKDHFTEIGFIKIEEWNSAINNWKSILNKA